MTSPTEETVVREGRIMRRLEITVEDNIPLPPKQIKTVNEQKLEFLLNLKVGQSFAVSTKTDMISFCGFANRYAGKQLPVGYKLETRKMPDHIRIWRTK